MRKYNVVVITTLMFLLCACAGTQTKAVSSYELAGITLKTAYNLARPGCDAGTIPSDKCLEIKGIYNSARASYLIAGDALAIAIEVNDLVKRQAALEEYQDAAMAFTAMTTKLIELLTKFGVIKGRTL